MKKQPNKNKSKRENTPFLLILYALLTETAFFIASCILALILDIKQGNYYIFCLAALSVGSLASGFISARITRKKGMLNGIIYALPSNILFTLISASLNSFSVDYNVILSLAMLVVCSAAGGIASVNIRSRKIITPKRAKR